MLMQGGTFSGRLLFLQIHRAGRQEWNIMSRLNPGEPELEPHEDKLRPALKTFYLGGKTHTRAWP